MNKTTNLLIALAILPIISAPVLADGNSAVLEFAGTKWRLAELPGASIDDAVKSTLIFSTDSVGGNGGCNGFGGGLVIDTQSIDINQIISTQMACKGLDQEQAYFAALEAATGFELVDGDLVLTRNGEKLARLSPMPD